MSPRGKVVLVGAGPGDPGLITVRGLAAVRAADCLVYDRLVSPELLKETKPGCACVFVGKENRRHTMPQEEINALLAEMAGTYAYVVRLKGGDPFVFGRGLEEMSYLRARGIACEEIPGVTSAIAGPAAAGIPVTHRGVAQAFHVYTAHDRNDALAELDFASMRDDRATYVFLMGLSKLGEIVARLLDVGKSPATPVAVIASATLPTQATVRGTLGDIAAKVVAAALASPAVIVVGGTVDAGLPVADVRGMRCLVPTLEEPSRLAALLRARGADVTEVRVGEIVPFVEAIPPDADWLAVTSRNAVPALVRAFNARGGALPRPKLAAVGEKTAAALRAAGLSVDFTAPVATGEALRRALARHVPGARVQAFKGYENRPVAFAAPLDLSAFDAAYFTCASSVERVLAQATGRTRCLAIGPSTAAALRERGIDPVVSAEASLEALAAL